MMITEMRWLVRYLPVRDAAPCLLTGGVMIKGDNGLMQTKTLQMRIGEYKRAVEFPYQAWCGTEWADVPETNYGS